jgi:hypothetical protein
MDQAFHTQLGHELDRLNVKGNQLAGLCVPMAAPT